MEDTTYQIIDGKVIIRVRDHICETGEDLLASPLFMEILRRCTDELARHNSYLLGIFPDRTITHQNLRRLVDTMHYLLRVPADKIPCLVDESEYFLRDRALLNDFVEYLYNYWRNLQRLVICDSEGTRFDKRPYRTFTNTVEQLTHVVRSTYRDLQESMKREYDASMGKLDALNAALRRTDDLIDRIVYALYGLGPEEIAIIEESLG